MGNSEREELKPCPFCGGEPSLALCGFGTAEVECMTDECGTRGPRKPSVKAAIAAWNRRAKHSTAEPVAYLVPRSAFRCSPLGQDAESHEWLEVTEDTSEKDAFPVYAAPQQAPLTDEQKPPNEQRIAEMVRYRFASTNRTAEFSMYTHWYKKGVLDGWEEFRRGISAGKEKTNA